MLEKVIEFFAKRHLMMNFIFIAVVAGGILAWQNTNKEELPDVTFDSVRISVGYPGAPAEDVEFYVTKPIEEAVTGLDGVYRITSSSSVGNSSVRVEMERDLPDFDEALMELRNAVLDVDLPEEVLDDPNVRVFKTSKKAILDIALLHKDYEILTVEGRRELQKYALALETQLINLQQINSVNRNGYLQEELQIKLRPDKLIEYETPFNTIMQQIRENHIRKPAGTLEAQGEPKVTLVSELDTPEKVRAVSIQGGFDGKMIRLGDVADVDWGYEKPKTINKVNGHEAVMFSVVKNSSAGILEALKSTDKVLARFRGNNLKGTAIEVVLLDDESIDLRNRLHIIGVNAIIGFVLIMVTLFSFLNARAAIWVSMGIPFTFCASMLGAALMGYTINGVTLAAVIIVMGMVVDDAIVVAENITRLMRNGMDRARAVIEGTSFVMLPIVASIVTTCIAFVPLFFFTSRHGRIIEHIPPIIFLMLGASLFESLFILPGHMALNVSLPGPFKKKVGMSERRAHWFDKVEARYAAMLEVVLKRKTIVFLLFAVLLGFSGYIYVTKLKFEMFPHEETRDISITGETASGMTKYETARKVRELENLVLPSVGADVVGVRTVVARGRRGSSVRENSFWMLVEILPRDKRERSADEIVAEIEKGVKALEGFSKVKIAKSRWGQSSGSPIEILIQQNDDSVRQKVADMLAASMRQVPDFKNVEIEEEMRVSEYRVSINRDMIKRLSISPGDVVSTFRAALEGTVLYEFSNGDEDIRARLSTVEESKDKIEKLLALPVENRNNYLVSLGSIVSVTNIVSPNAIARRDMKRTAKVFADMSGEGKKTTPVEVADRLEEEVFPAILSTFPTTALSFAGEVQDTRESTADLRNAVIMVILLVFTVLAVLFNSLTKPLVIMLAIPFGLVGIVLAFWLHGKVLFGFYAAVGALGLAGVVINDAIIMLTKLDREFVPCKTVAEIIRQTSTIASSRLRAVVLTTLTTVAGVLPTAYGFAGYDAMLSEMMLALTWGLIFGTIITLLFVPSVFAMMQQVSMRISRKGDEA